MHKVEEITNSLNSSISDLPTLSPIFLDNPGKKGRGLGYISVGRLIIIIIMLVYRVFYERVWIISE